jgi:geranylgeranyl reductase family protein
MPEKNYDVIVVGAGPAGCKTAEIIAKKGYGVLVLEEHPQIGKPTQCTGLVSQRIGKIPKEIIVNKIKIARFFSGSEHFEIKSKKSVYVIDRRKFDKYVAEEAKKAGVDFKLSTRFLDFKEGEVTTSNGKYRTKILIGADGPNSSVAKISGIELPNNILYAAQVRVKSRFNSDTVELWFGSDIAPGLFAWVVPESNIKARVGLATDKNLNKFFDKFFKKRLGRIESTDRIGDVIRYGLIKKSVTDNVLLVGDAACQIKPFSAGGLVYGQIGANYTGEACVKALEANDFSEKFLIENYDKKWKKELAGPIRKGMIMKKMFHNFGKPFSFKLIKNLGITKLSSVMDMDFLGKD